MMNKKMTLLVTVAFFCMAIFMMTSCGTTSSTVEGDTPPVSTGDTTTSADEDQPAIVDLEEETIEAERPAEPQEQTEAAQAYLAQQVEDFQAPIFFDFDKSDLKPESQASLRNKASFLKKNSSFSVRIEGHTDERGTNEYNLALGERRAEAAAKYLRSLGISNSRISTLSYGEEKPAVFGSNEGAWSKNRRDEFVLIK